MISRYFIRGCCHHKDLKCVLINEDSFIFKECFDGCSLHKKFTPKLLVNTKTEPERFLKTGSARKIKLCDRFNVIQQSRAFHSSCVLYVSSESKKPSSKVEETTVAIKEKAKEVTLNKVDLHPSTDLDVKVSSNVKKNLRQKILDEIYHYYHGFRLLFIDIKVSSVLVWKVLKGETLTRREYNLLIRTVGDMFRLVPFSIFIIVPFMELLLPVFIKLFPGMLPSTFQTSTEKDDKMKQSLKVKLEMAKFLQQTLDEMALTGKGHNSQAAKDFIEFFHKVRTEGGGLTTNEEILKFSKLFEDEITLDSLTRSQLIALCRVLELQPFGTTNLLRFQLRMKLRSLAADDHRIKKEGVESLTQSELQQACRARGMRALGMSEKRLRTQLTQWLDLSLNEKVPPSLLLLSRAFMLPETITTTEKLVATISALPDTVATKTKAVIGEREGKVDNKTKIELIKEEVAKIQEEKKEIEEEAKVETFEVELIDKAPSLIDKSSDLIAKEEKDISAKDIGETLENVLDAVSKFKKKLLIEKEELDDLKEEMKDYDEDVQHLKEVTELAKDTNENIDVKESKAAKRLSRTVNKLIKKMDVTLTELEGKGTAKKATLQKNDLETSDDAPGIRMDELIEAIHKLQKVPDTSKLEKIIDVLEKIDIDKDGVVKVDDLLKVLEVLDRENIKLKQKQIEDVIDLLKKEEAINEEIVLDSNIDHDEPKIISNKENENVNLLKGSDEKKSQKYKIAISPTLDDNIQSNISAAPDSRTKAHVEKKANGHRDDSKKP